MLLPHGVQGAALDLGDLDALGWQWATSLAALAEAEALLLVRAGLRTAPEAGRMPSMQYGSLKPRTWWVPQSQPAPGPQARPTPSLQFQRPHCLGSLTLAAPRSPLVFGQQVLGTTETFRRRWGPAVRQQRSLGLSVGLTRPALHPSTPSLCPQALQGAASAQRRLSHLGLLHALHSCGVLLGAGAEHLRAAGVRPRCAFEQASYHPGGFMGWGSAHSRKKGACPPAGLSFLPFSACLLHPSV